MRTLFGVIFCILIFMTIVAQLWIPLPLDPSRRLIVWATDPNPVRKEQIAQFEMLYPDYAIRIDPNNRSPQKIIIQAASNVGPTVFDSYGAGHLANYVEAGVVADVTELALEMGFHYSKTFEAAWPNFVYKGRQYGFPCNVNGTAMWINKTVFKKYGVPIPENPEWTWDEFIEIAKKVTIARKDGPGKECFGLAVAEPLEMIRQYGGEFYSPDGTRCTLNTPAATEGLKRYLDLMFEFNICPTPDQASSMANEGGWGAEHQMFARGRFAMMRGGRWQAIIFRKYYKPADGEDPLELTALPLPRAPGRPPLNTVGARCALVSADVQDLKDAGVFLQYLASQRYNEELNRAADALPPLKSFCESEAYAFNPAYPHEDFHQTFLDILAHGVGDPVSPFINPRKAMDIFKMAVEGLRGRYAALSAEQRSQRVSTTLQEIANRIDTEIRRNISRSKRLQTLFEETQQQVEH